MVTLEDLRGDSLAICGSFNKIREEIRAVAKNKDEEDAMLTERILIDLIEFSRRKRSAVPLDCDNEKGLEEEKKKKRVRVIPPKNPLNIEPKNSNHITREEGKRRKRERQGKKPAEEKQTVEEQSPSMPTELKDKIMGLHGRDVQLVIQKKLTTTNTEDSQDQLSIPRGQIVRDGHTLDSIVVQTPQNNNEMINARDQHTVFTWFGSGLTSTGLTPINPL